jgi:ectoine hydroxylase-related dioxygenase (phytanoyl-CoA dioxygenase family)
MPLDDTDEENGCMTFLPRSHRLDVLGHRHIDDDPKVHGLQLLVEVDTSGAVAVPLAAGGATFHHPRTIHATGPNRSPRRRRAWANEFQTAPVAAEVVPERPWLHAGREEWGKRDVFR